MRCTNCGTELIAGKLFCHACGARATQACTNCGAAVAPGFRFCPDCGAPVAAAPPLLAAAEPPAPPPRATPSARHAPDMPEELAQKIRASKDALEGERKQVTVLFCDLAGSTAMAEGLDPEEYHDLLEQYLELAFREIYRCEGIVNQLAGDGLMALFGAPIAHEDAPQRALRAALGIQDALARFNEHLLEERGLELRARVGIHTGPVVVGTVGNDLKMDYTAIGDTTNLASRLESLAEPGSILMSEATYRLVRGLFRVRPVGPFTVKGKTEPVPAYAVLGVSPVTTPMALAAERGLTPLVGRDAELAQVDACFQRLRSDFAQVVTVIGDAGSGKSRLLYEFKQRLADEPAVFFEARCSAWNQLVPYYPFVAMLRQYFDLAADEPVSCGCDKVARKLRDWDPQLDHVYPYLCRMLSLPVAGDVDDLPADDQIKRETFEAVGHLIMRETERGPVVMMIEDLQWMDEPSREMLDAAVAEMGRKPLMLLVTHRPDFQPAWRTHAAFTQLRLRRLNDDDVVQITRTLAGGSLPAELERLILSKAEGSPFLTEEITRALIEEGHLSRDDGQQRLTRPVEEIRIPGTVQEVIAARLDRLGPSAKRVVQVASVLGRQFHRAHLVQLLASEGVDVAHELDELERRGVVHRKNLFSNDEYRFGESLTQEVAYEGLLLKQRRQWHERIGALIEASPSERSAERSAALAHHFARSDNRDKSIPALLQAARDAEQVPAFRSAARFYREAWDLAVAGRDADARLQRLAVDAAIGLSRMVVIYNAAAPDDIVDVLTRARALAEALGDNTAAPTLRTYLGMVIMRSGRDRFDEGVALVEEGLALAQQAGQTQAAVGVSRALAWSYVVDGRFAVARRTIDWVVQELERAGGRQQLADIYLGARWLRTVVAYHSDDLVGAEAEAIEIYDMASAANNRTVRGSSASLRALLHFLRAEYAEARSWAERSLEVAQQIGNASTVASAGAIALAVAVELAEPVAAARYADLVEHAVDDGAELSLNGHIVVAALLAMGDVKRAARVAEAAYAHASGRLREMHSALGMADVRFHLGPDSWAEAQRWYDQSVALAETLGTRAHLAAARLGAGELAAARGATQTALRQLRQARELCRAFNLRHYLARAERALADVDGGAHAPAQGA